MANQLIFQAQTQAYPFVPQALLMGIRNGVPRLLKSGRFRRCEFHLRGLRRVGHFSLSLQTATAYENIPPVSLSQQKHGPAILVINSPIDYFPPPSQWSRPHPREGEALHRLLPLANLDSIFPRQPIPPGHRILQSHLSGSYSEQQVIWAGR